MRGNKNITKKKLAELQRENGRVASIIVNYHLNTRRLPVGKLFQVTCGT